MRASEHPEFEIEDRHLKSALAVISQELRHGQNHPLSPTAYRNAQLEISRLDRQHASNMQMALAEPYFVRVDFVRGGSNSAQAIYIGKFGVRGPDTFPTIVDWQAPIAQLYYKQQWQDANYLAPEGRLIRGSVTLRRNFKIHGSRLEEILDEAPKPLVVVRAPSHRDGLSNETEIAISPFLEGVLAESRDAKLRDIVATIQPEQYSLIEAPLRGVLFVQGVAGSGKTSLALHRLAYLLYHHQDTIAADRMMVIGPSTLFLRSVSNILPGLGVQGIPQMTFAEWAKTWLGDTLKVETHDVHLERLIDPNFEQRVGSKEYHLLGTAATFLYRLKGSMRMASLLRAHVAATKIGLSAQARTVQVVYTTPEESGLRKLEYARSTTVSLNVSANDVGNIVRQICADASDDLRLGHLRDQCIESLTEQLWRTFQTTTIYGRPEQFRDERERQEWERRDVDRSFAFRTSIKEAVRNNLNEWWPTITPTNCYRSLIANKDRLTRAALEEAKSATTPLREWELELLHTPEAKRRDYRWQPDDLAPLCYTDLILNGPREQQYDHIFADEAQELSSLELHLLYLHAKDCSMTLVGDFAQGLGMTGIRDLSNLSSALDGTTITHAAINSSYRSTYEITTFANRLMRHISAYGTDRQVARPVSRHGPAPDLAACASRRQLLTKTIDVILAAQKQGHQTIAVICKTLSSTKEFAEILNSRHIPFVSIESREDVAKDGVVVVPAYLAKGLEFDTVVVIDADEKTYQLRDQDAKLLYIAVTRALHELHVFWIGNASPLLGLDSHISSTPA